MVGAGRERARLQARMRAHDLEGLRPDRAGRAQDGHRSHGLSVGGADWRPAPSAGQPASAVMLWGSSARRSIARCQMTWPVRMSTT